MPNYETLTIEKREDGIAILTINRPDKLNALNAKVMSELDAAADALATDRSVRGVVVTGAGERAFVAGADIAELANLDAATGRELSIRGQAIFAKLENMPKPVIAAVEGYALGGGCELALACHIRIAGEKAVFGLPEVTLGLIPGYGGTQRLAMLVGRGRALEMILTGAPCDAQTAATSGLVNRVVTSGTVVEEAVKMLHTILKRAPVAVGEAIGSVLQSGTPQGYAAEADAFSRLCATQDFREGTRAFLAKEKPAFKGE